jgi:hypothetical protein
MFSPRRLLAALVVFFAIGGCSRPTQPPPSAFFSGINSVKLKAIADQSAPDAVKKWGAHGSGGGATDKFFEGDFQCEPEFRSIEHVVAFSGAERSDEPGMMGSLLHHTQICIWACRAGMKQRSHYFLVHSERTDS